MAELTYTERLQPSLLDRLTDEAPGEKTESRNRRVISMSRLRSLVRRDLAWLLNCGHMESLQDLSDFPEVQRSVLNYGLPDLSGTAVSGMTEDQIERMVKSAILAFEPRILPNTIRVRADISPSNFNRNAIVFEIVGQLWAQPMPTELFLKTELDLETGDVNVIDAVGVKAR
ncbi:MAG: type VI secretion system baseplate subunit TssE [Wenzhouxiangella sp.]|nr:type VI secretion system baseplate subunit TssE [Wenzhouxiangella sp.]MCH8477297.1 type VI secretion system baseplate subunit TssE [Wenzhouxiangella sp.]TVR95957.1 MAG: type VI secretion system baseplate subunit TssE [Wenzhouxiangellaceae bacterium]